MAASDYKSTVQQIKDAPLEELRKDPRVWMAYERGWCDFMQAYVGAQLMQSNAEVELCDYVNYHTRRTRQLAAAGNETDADVTERERSNRRQRAERPVATVSAARRRYVEKTGAAVEPEDDRAAEQERGGRRRAHSPDDYDRDAAAVAAVQESMGRIRLADWPASGTSDEDGRFRSV